MPRTFIYIQTVDNDSAPCAPAPTDSNSPAFASLAICKPGIRRTANIGDRIVGITGKIIERDGHPPNAIIWAGIIDEIISWKEYTGSQYHHRMDCIYAFDETTETFFRKENASVHLKPGDLTHDLGEKSKHYPKAWVILCRDFRYWGRNAIPLSRISPALGETVRRGYRKAKRDDRDALIELNKIFGPEWQRQTAYTPQGADLVDLRDEPVPEDSDVRDDGSSDGASAATPVQPQIRNCKRPSAKLSSSAKRRCR